MTLVKLHACQYRKVKRFPDIGQRFTREGFCLGLRAAPPVHGWRGHAPLALRLGGGVIGDSSLRSGPIGLRRDRLPGCGGICPPTSCWGTSCCFTRRTPDRTGSRVRAPGRLQLLIRRLRHRQRFRVRRQPDSGRQPARHGLELQELDQEPDRNDRGHLYRDGGKHPENWRRLRGESQQGERETKQHGEASDDEAEERQEARMRRSVTQDAEADQNRQHDQRHRVRGSRAQCHCDICQRA